MFKAIKKYIQEKRIERAIKKANYLKALTGYKQLVIMQAGKPTVVSKKTLKLGIHAGNFIKGVVIQDLERIAIYKTT